MLGKSGVDGNLHSEEVPSYDAAPEPSGLDSFDECL
jgi:hypothetical protein